MHTERLRELAEISAYAGGRADYTQGGGGNTSVKLQGGLMAIKASGFRLCDMTETEGYVTVRYRDVAAYYAGVDTSQDKDFEKESADAAKNSVSLLPGMREGLRPSVEVGFHSVLSNYVIHTHSVYANLLACALKGEQLAAEAFADADFKFIWMPYINPGFTLTLRIMERLRAFETAPEVIFMQNHGVIVHADTPARAMELHERVNALIKEYFRIPEGDFSEITLKQTAENVFESQTATVLSFVKHAPLGLEQLDAVPLYPDQLVYLNSTLRNTPGKMEVSHGKVTYFAGEKEARTLDETLAAYLYVVGTLNRLNLEISVMSQKETDFINNWEAEKYRRTLAK